MSVIAHRIVTSLGYLDAITEHTIEPGVQHADGLTKDATMYLREQKSVTMIHLSYQSQILLGFQLL